MICVRFLNYKYNLVIFYLKVTLLGSFPLHLGKNLNSKAFSDQALAYFHSCLLPVYLLFLSQVKFCWISLIPSFQGFNIVYSWSKAMDSTLELDQIYQGLLDFIFILYALDISWLMINNRVFIGHLFQMIRGSVL